MASTPTTKSQVQAYRFVLRRMESALVRKDAVMLHDPMGSHKRATVAGAILACIGLVGFLVWGLFGGKGSVPEPGSVVIAKESGSAYVVSADKNAKKRLIPTLNMASAKLLVMAQGANQGGQAIEPTTVKEAALAEFPRGPRTGMVNAPTYLPDAGNPADPAWATCDVGDVSGQLNAAQNNQAVNVHTTVIGGESDHGTPLAPNQAMYVRDQTSQVEYLVYVPREVPGQPNTKVVKAPIDQADSVVLDYYNLRGETPRTISTNMLNSIPSAPMDKLSVPDIESQGSPAGYMTGGNYQVGDVVQRPVPGQVPQYFVLLKDGKQEVSRGAAAVVHASKSGSGDIPNAANALAEAKTTQNEVSQLKAFPEVVPSPVSFQDSSASCLSWNNVNGDHNITMTTKNGPLTQRAPVELAQSDGPGQNVDFFYMPAGKSAVIRGSSNEAGDGGPISLVSDQGVTYGIKDVPTAQGLGVIKSGGDLKDGPAWITKVLPSGDFLDPAAASVVYDTVPAAPGINRPPEKKQ